MANIKTKAFVAVVQLLNVLMLAFLLNYSTTFFEEKKISSCLSHVI